MPKNLSAKSRSELMAKVKSKGNRSTEKKLVTILKSLKVNGWRRHTKLVGRPDFEFRDIRTVVFVDGCFWHGCPACHRLPKTNTDYWTKKVARNIERDNLVTNKLEIKGWRVLRIWEHELKSKHASQTRERLEDIFKKNDGVHK